MANNNLPKGFKPKNVELARKNEYVIKASETSKPGDVLYFDASAGTLTATPHANNPICGVQASYIKSSTTGDINATAVAGDLVDVWDDITTEYVGQISTFTATDPVTTKAAAACYDVAGNAGLQYIDAAASTYDVWKVIKLDYENNVKKSIAGAYAKVLCVLNPTRCAKGPFA
jgi:hypothetical protein